MRWASSTEDAEGHGKHGFPRDESEDAEGHPRVRGIRSRAVRRRTPRGTGISSRAVRTRTPRGTGIRSRAVRTRTPRGTGSFSTELARTPALRVDSGARPVRAPVRRSAELGRGVRPDARDRRLADLAATVGDLLIGDPSRAAIASSGPRAPPCRIASSAGGRRPRWCSRTPARPARGVGPGTLDVLGYGPCGQLGDQVVDPPVGLTQCSDSNPGETRTSAPSAQTARGRWSRRARPPRASGEQDRPLRSAEHGPVDDEGRTDARVARVDRGPVEEPQVRLAGVVFSTRTFGRAAGSAGRVRRRDPWKRSSSRRARVGGQVLEVSDEQRAAARPAPCAGPERERRPRGERARSRSSVPRTGRPRGAHRRRRHRSGRPRARGPVARRGRSPGSRPPLAVELFAVEPGPADEVGQQLDRLVRRPRLGERTRKATMSCDRPGVARAPMPLAGLVDLSVGGVGLGRP